MKTWKVELTAERSSLAEAKIQRGIFQGDSPSPLLFIIVIVPLSHKLRKCTAEYKLSKLQEKKNQSSNVCRQHQSVCKNMKKNWKLIHAMRIYSQDVGIECSTENCAILVMKSRKHLTDRM